MSKTRISVSIFFLRIIYKLICGLVSVLKNSAKLISIKIAIGTLIISLNTSLLFAQQANKPKKIYAKNDTLRLDVTLEQEVINFENQITLCYYSGPPNYLEPTFIGEETLNDFIAKNLNYPLEAIRNRIEGTVIISCIIDIYGKVKDIKVIKSLGHGCDDAAIKVISKLPKFTIGYKGRRSAEFEKIITVEFKLHPNCELKF